MSRFAALTYEDIINLENKKDSKSKKCAVKRAVALFRDCQHRNQLDTDLEVFSKEELFCYFFLFHILSF